MYHSGDRGEYEQSRGTWRTITYDLQHARTRLEAADILVFDIWEVIPYSHAIFNIVEKTELVEIIVSAAWSMFKTGQRHAIGLLLDSDPLHRRVHAALVRAEFTVHSLEIMNSSDDAGYFDDVMSTLINATNGTTISSGGSLRKPAVTLYSGGDPGRRPGLHEAIRKALMDEIHVVVVAWHWNLNDVYQDLAVTDPFLADLRIRLLEDILAYGEKTAGEPRRLSQQFGPPPSTVASEMNDGGAQSYRACRVHYL